MMVVLVVGFRWWLGSIRGNGGGGGWWFGFWVLGFGFCFSVVIFSLCVF